METGVVIQINISAGGVPKQPIPFAEARKLGLAGDKHIYPLHGGPEKALLLIASEVVDELRAEGFAVYYGALGENLTTQGLNHRMWRRGRRYQVGEALIELTEPRAPCRKLNPYGKGIQKRILQCSGESGYYAAVLTPGLIVTRDMIRTSGR